MNPFNPQEVATALALLKTPPSTTQQAHNWHMHFNQLSKILNEAQTTLELACARDQTHKDHRERLEHFERHVWAQILACRGELMDQYLSLASKGLIVTNNPILNDVRNRKTYALPALGPLILQEQTTVRAFQTWFSQLRAKNAGELVPLSVVAGRMNHKDPQIRSQACQVYYASLQAYEPQIQAYFDQLLDLRLEQKKMSGALSYAHFAFAELGRLDYTPEDCAFWCQRIAKTLVPTIQSLLKQPLAPWEIGGFSHLQPGEGPWTTRSLIALARDIVGSIDPEFLDLFLHMEKEQLIDISPRRGKTPGAFSVVFHNTKQPFLFGNFGPCWKDLITFLHEFGHCAHAYFYFENEDMLMRQPGYEFCELASTAFELLASYGYHTLWPQGDIGEKAIKYQLSQMLLFWPFVAMIDTWQHEVYTHKLRAQERNALWQALTRKYRPYVDAKLCPGFDTLGWMSRPHVFTSPFYYIDYGLAQMGAVSLWRRSLDDKNKSIKDFIRAMRLGATQRVPDLFTTAGATWDLKGEHLGALCAWVADFLK